MPKSGLEAGFEPSPLTTKYKVGLALVALGMVLVTAFYLGMILVLTWGVVYHFKHNGYMLHGDLLTGLAYFGFGIGGPILAFFLVKPFFAGRLPEPNRFTLTAESDPELFKIIARICNLAGVPLPSRVDVDCLVNASVSYRDGWRSIRNNDLVLTIGLPLAASLTTQEFAGVLAHEFGHFSQRAGMRLTYIIRSLSNWFARVVYERDIWDVMLVRVAYALDLRIGFFFHLLRFGVWLSRRVLWVLMHVGGAFSCFMLRQMEFDADTYEARVAGSDGFARTMVKLQSLHAAFELINESMQERWQKRCLPDDLPGFLNHAVAHLTPELRNKMEGAAKKRAGIFDSHPSDAARVEAASALKQQGIVHDLEPASSLFKDFEGLSKAATRLLYEDTFEVQIADQHLVSHLVEAGEKQLKADGEKAMSEFFLGARLKYRPILISLPEQSADGVEELAAESAKSRAAMEQLRSEVLKAEREFEEAETLYQRGLNALVQSSQQATERASARMRAVLPVLEEFERHAQLRLKNALQLLRFPEVAGKISDAATLGAEVAKLLPLYERLSRTFSPLQELRRNVESFGVALEGDRDATRLALAQARAGELALLIQSSLAEVKKHLLDIPEDLRKLEGNTLLAELAALDVPTVQRSAALLNYGRRFNLELLPFSRRVLARLTWIAMQVEAVALAPTAG